ESHSSFLLDLKSRGFDVDTDSKSLFAYDTDRIYDHVILGPSSNIDAKQLLSFLEDGGNILAIGSTDGVKGELRRLAHELGMALPPIGSKLIDHFKAPNKDAHDILILDESSNTIPEPYVHQPGSKPLIYSGTGFSLLNNPLVLPILKAFRTSYVSSGPESAAAVTEPWVAGSQTYLAGAFQAYNNARFVFVGSDLFFSNKYYNDNKYGNKQFAEDLTKWAFRETGVIAVSDVSHGLANPEALKAVLDANTTTLVGSNGPIYRIKEDIIYSIDLSIWDPESASWTPYQANDDVQVEFIMLDPYYRLNLQNVGNTEDQSACKYQVEFKIPDHHGVFTFAVDYKRPGLAFIEDRRTVTVRHYAHNEFTRSYAISSSWVYLSAIMSIIGAWVIFVVSWV
ncbi:hypothetical protein CANCADRAFT_14039, partial [Tortispora caseinolytica NRRL Y-17796]